MKKSGTDGYIIIIMGHARSLFRDFESYLRILNGLDEEDIRLISKQYNSNFVTYGLDPGNYTFKNLSDAVYTMGDHEGILQIEHDDFSMKTTLSLSRFGATFGTLRFDKKIFF